MKNDNDKYFLMQDDDIKITYERRRTAEPETIHGFNPIIIFVIVVISLFCAVTIGNNNNSSQQSPVIINNN